MAAGLRKMDRAPEDSGHAFEVRVRRILQRMTSDTFSLTPVRTVSAEATLTVDDFLLNCTGGSFAVNLPSARGIPGRPYVVKKSTAGTITVTPSGAETIDGSASVSVTAGNVVRLLADDSGNWLTW